MKNFFYRIFCGFFLGLSVFAPGVSGSVMAVMMGIYDQLLTVISNPFKNFKKNVIYLIPLGIGVVLSLVLFILAFEWLFDNYEKATYLLFLGLMAGNLPVVFKGANKEGFKGYFLIGIIIAFAIALAVGIMRYVTPESQASAVTDPTFIYLAVCGLVAGVCSMMPGMSISMILITLGIYNYLLHTARAIVPAFGRHELAVAGVVAGCFIIGMIGFSNVTKRIFDRYSGFANFMVFGFMCGSLASICINLPPSDEKFNWFVGALMLLIGLGISLLFVFLSRKFNVEEKAAPIPLVVTEPDA